MCLPSSSKIPALLEAKNSLMRKEAPAWAKTPCENNVSNTKQRILMANNRFIY